MTTHELQKQIRAVRAEMKAKRIRRVSFMNAGLDPETYRLNALMFALETQLTRARKGQPKINY